jgi:hypothetical protein
MRSHTITSTLVSSRKRHTWRILLFLPLPSSLHAHAHAHAHSHGTHPFTHAVPCPHTQKHTHTQTHFMETYPYNIKDNCCYPHLIDGHAPLQAVNWLRAHCIAMCMRATSASRFRHTHTHTHTYIYIYIYIYYACMHAHPR